MKMKFMCLNSNLKEKIGLIVITSAISIVVSAILFFSVTYFLLSNKQNYAILFSKNKVTYENIKKYNNVKDILKNTFYENVDENVLLEGSIEGMTSSLNDPYTIYCNKEHMEVINQITEGNYAGIGAALLPDKNGILTIMDVFDGSPAKEVGIIRDDKIIKVNDKDVTSISNEELIIKMIKGPEKTKVKLTIFRPSENRSIDFEITRKVIKARNIEGNILDENIGYIHIRTFDDQIAENFNTILEQQLAKNIKRLIIDVRDNPGGRYDQVIKIANRLLPECTIVYTEDKKGHKEYEKSDKNSVNLPIVVLVNGGSASASEILAGALRDNKKCTLIGTKTFGKGLVQAVNKFNDGSGLIVTIARYFTPSGVCIQGKGIFPDIEVQPFEKFKNMPIARIPKGEDLQLLKAIEYVKTK